MNAIYKSIYTINYEREQVIAINTPESFDEYVSELIDHISNNNSVREYKTQSNSTEVIGCIKELCNNIDNNELVNEKMNIIANRLLREEIKAQNQIERTRTQVKKGSLIQVLLLDEREDTYTYLLAKIEHSEWVDDADFLFKTGFSKDKKTIWKSCLFDLSDLESICFSAKIYSDTKARYWCKGFLELEEMNNDEFNTDHAFKAIESTLNRGLKKSKGPDYTLIRNSFIVYMNNNEHIDFPTMVESVVGNYRPVSENISEEQITELKEKLLELPKKRKFDSQFNTALNIVNNRCKKVYSINTGIDLKISRPISELTNTIIAIEEDGAKYLKIRTNNEETYNQFCF